jgi:hypothetical protein
MQGPAPLLAAALSLAAVLRAAPPAPMGFAPPEVALADFNTRSLRAGDLNGDGLTDLILLNNERGRIDVYLHNTQATPTPTPILRTDRWQPSLADSRFLRQSLIPGGALFDLVLGDFNADGKTDFAVTDDQNRILIYHGPVVPAWVPFARLPVTAAQNMPNTLAWDPAEKAIVLLGEKDIQEVRWNPETQSYTATTVASPPREARPYNLLLRDSNGDGRLDVLYSVRLPRFNLAVHPRRPEGLGGLQLPLVDPPAEAFTPFGEQPGRFLALHPRSGALQQLSFADNPAALTDASESLDTRFLNIPSLRNPQSAWADLNGDGLSDLILYAPGQPEIVWLECLADNQFSAPRRQPVPAGGSWMLPGHWTPGATTPSILLHDLDSAFLGISPYRDGRLHFPDALENTVKILGASPWRPEGAEQDLLVGIVRDERKYELRIWKFVPNDGGVLEMELLQQTPLPAVTRDLYAPLPIQLSPGGPMGFLVCSAFENAFFLIPDGPESLALRDTATGFSTNLLRRKKPEDFLILPPSPAFPSTWTLLQDASLQFLAADDNGIVRVIDQINLNGSGKIAGILPFDPEGKQLGLFDSTRNLVELHSRDERGLLQFRRDLLLPPTQAQQTRLHASDAGFQLRVIGRDQVALVFPRAPSQRLSIEPLYETDLPETTHQQVLVGDFNGDQQADIALLDPSRSQTLEFLHQTDGRWNSIMHFQIFDTAQMPGGRRGGEQEPREVLVLDMNGDKLDDLLLLIHDRILLYLQDPVLLSAPRLQLNP